MTALILMAWAEGGALCDRFAAARRLWPAGGRGATYPGFTKALRRHGHALAGAAAESLRRHFEAVGAAAHRCGFFVLAVDGSRFELPRTEAHEHAFGVAGRGEGTPQIWVTMLWQMGLGLPWDWRLGSAGASGRHHLRQMLDRTPEDTLLVMDAGFTGYELLRIIAETGRHFLLRVGGNVELLRELGHPEIAEGGQTVHLWPADAQDRRRPPLTLRLIKRPDAHDRRRRVYLLTSVRDPERLSDEDAETLYRQRWGVELCYRSLKQTLEGSKLRSHAPDQAGFELHGLILGLSLLGWMGTASIADAGADPQRWSVASALRTVRAGLRAPGRRLSWPELLGGAVTDRYARTRKTRRRWPRKKQRDAPPGRPRLRHARAAEKALAQELTCAEK